MTDIIKAMNPTAPLHTEEAALGAAKVSAVGILIGAIHQAVGGWYASTPEAAAAAGRLIERLTGQAPTAEQMAASAQQGMIMGVALAVLQLGLAFWQWKKPNIVLPILFLVLCIWGLGTSALGLAMGAEQPVYLSVFSIVAMLIAVVTHIAGIRGASALGKIRYEAANTYED
ncbi:hypothetical protein [Brevundimonas sp.]|jgi:hypothetical protein|uniref:hypothetical protein n=1 Tax=Brevundimonas sp. TaxID=1871086 RepID=UPI002EDAAC84